MKHILSFLLLFVGISLLAQNGESEREALKLYQSGETLLEKEPLVVFDKVQALENFQASKKILQTGSLENAELQAKNDSQIQVLLTFFSTYQNPDSLLELSLFFPDSVFQANPSYTSDFKSLITEYLQLKNRIARSEFLDLKNLNNEAYLSKEEDIATPISFEKYWAIEVLELEKWLKEQENNLRFFPIKVREELLYRRLEERLDTLKNQQLVQNYDSNINRLLERLEIAESETAAIAKNYRQLRNIGLGGFFLLLIGGYFFWRKNTQLLESKNQSLREEKKKSEDLLLNILPTEVVRQLKDKKSAKAQRYDSVCVLFSDFQNFSQISKNLPPEELVSELDYCFSAYDRIIEKYHLDKIKTIGDAYMCVGGLYTRGNKHIPRMVAAAIEIQQFLENRKTQRSMLGGYFFEARIGIHTGPVVAGVIGTKKIAFDVWGDTVNIAQQMEQHGVVGKVNISGETYECVKDKFECTHRGAISIKNQKTYDMYFVDKMKIQ